MQEQKKKRHFRRLLLTLLVFYCLIALIPACVYWAAGKRGQEKAAASPAASGSAAPDEPVSGSSEALRERSPLPDFLEGYKTAPQNAASETSKEDSFPLYDQSTGETLEIPGKTLLAAAVACEMDLASPEEALKAQAVACYTLFSRKRDTGETIVCDSAAWQVWTTEELMRTRWGEDYEDNMAILNGAVNKVYGQQLQWEGQPILASYFAISSGSTETAGNVWEGDLPYLQAVASPGDILSDGYLSTAIFTLPDFQEAVASYFGGEAPEFSDDPENWLTDLETTPSGYVKSGVLCGKKLSGTELRSVFSLRSACFQLSQGEDGFTFTVRGWGHGVGMSQAGAVFLAKRGESYRDILSYYYPGAAISD